MCNSVHAHSMDNSKGEPNVNCGPWVTGTCQCRLLDCDRCTIWSGGNKAEAMGWGQSVHGSLPLNSAANLKVL